MHWPFITSPTPGSCDCWAYQLAATDEIELRYYFESQKLRCYLTRFGKIDLPGLTHSLYGKQHQIEISIDEAANYLQEFLDSQEKANLLLDPSYALREFAKHILKGEKCTT